LSSNEAESTTRAPFEEEDGDDDDAVVVDSQKLSSLSIPDSHTCCSSREDSRSSAGKLFERYCLEGGSCAEEEEGTVGQSNSKRLLRSSSPLREKCDEGAAAMSWLLLSSSGGDKDRWRCRRLDLRERRTVVEADANEAVPGM
jgi:hypothetical protein